MPTSRDPGSTALLVVDIQPDFLPGGALPVESAEGLLPQIRALMASEYFGLRVATQDWHPPGHISFASRHGREPFDAIELYGHKQELWPDHCVQGSPGAALHGEVNWNRISAIVRKGEDPECDSYSTFRNNWNIHGERPPTGLAGYLKDRNITDVYLAGLAREFCVKWSAEDASDAGFQTHVFWDASRPVDSASDEQTDASFKQHGIRIVKTADFVG